MSGTALHLGRPTLRRSCRTLCGVEVEASDADSDTPETFSAGPALSPYPSSARPTALRTGITADWRPGFRRRSCVGHGRRSPVVREIAGPEAMAMCAQLRLPRAAMEHPSRLRTGRPADSGRWVHILLAPSRGRVVADPRLPWRHTPLPPTSKDDRRRGAGAQGRRGAGAQGRRGAGAQGRRGAGAQGRRGAGAQGRRGAGAQGRRGAGAQGRRGAGAQGRRGAGAQGRRGAGAQGRRGAGAQGRRGAGAQGRRGAGAQGRRGAGAQGRRGAGAQGRRGAGAQGRRGAGAQGRPIAGSRSVPRAAGLLSLRELWLARSSGGLALDFGRSALTGVGTTGSGWGIV